MSSGRRQWEIHDNVSWPDRTFWNVISCYGFLILEKNRRFYSSISCVKALQCFNFPLCICHTHSLYSSPFTGKHNFAFKNVSAFVSNYGAWIYPSFACLVSTELIFHVQIRKFVTMKPTQLKGPLKKRFHFNCAVEIYSRIATHLVKFKLN